MVPQPGLGVTGSSGWARPRLPGWGESALGARPGPRCAGGEASPVWEEQGHGPACVIDASRHSQLPLKLVPGDSSRGENGAKGTTPIPKQRTRAGSPLLPRQWLPESVPSPHALAESCGFT